MSVKRISLNSFDKISKAETLKRTSCQTKSNELKLDDESVVVHFTIENLRNINYAKETKDTLFGSSHNVIDQNQQSLQNK